MSDAGRSDRRGGKRKRARFSIRFWNDDLQGHGHTLDLSPTGLYIETAVALEIGVRLHFEIKHPDGPFLGEAVVARKKRVPQRLRPIAAPGIGLRLVPLTSLLRSPEDDPISSHTLFELQVDLSDPVELEQAHSAGLGAGVLFVPCLTPPPVGAVVHVDVKLPAPYETLTWRGRAVQTISTPSGVAVELADRAPIDALVREILASCRG